MFGEYFMTVYMMAGSVLSSGMQCEEEKRSPVLVGLLGGEQRGCVRRGRRRRSNHAENVVNPNAEEHSRTYKGLVFPGTEAREGVFQQWGLW